MFRKPLAATRAPHFSLATRVPVETDERRRRLQHALNCSVPDLIDRALKALEEKIERDHQPQAAA